MRALIAGAGVIETVYGARSCGADPPGGGNLPDLRLQGQQASLQPEEDKLTLAT
jgi:hypothetical protein